MTATSTLEHHTIRSAKPAGSDTRQMLHLLLDENLSRDCEYDGELSNHLPMALQALQQMGASVERLQSYRTQYVRRYEGRASLRLQEPVLAPDWQRWLGDVARYPALLAHFRAALRLGGRDEVLREALPALLPGACAAAFHGPIRTAHALASDHADELAAGLAYWAARWQALPQPEAQDGALRALQDWMVRLREQAPAWHSTGRLIYLRMDDASRSPLYAELAQALAPARDAPTRLRELAGLALQAYLDSGNFTVLHMITGLRALRVLSPWISDWSGVQALLSRCFVAAYMAGHVRPLPTGAPAPPPDWQALFEAAVASDDDHVPKLVHASHEEALVYGDDERYRRAAALVLDRHAKR